MEGYNVTGPVKNLIRFCQSISYAREENGVEISIVAFHRDPQGKPGMFPFLEAAQKAGIETDLLIERYRFDVRIYDQLRAIIARRKPRIIQTHAIKANFLVRTGGFHKTHPWIAFHHGYTAEDWKMLAYNQFNRFTLPAARRVVTVCEPFARDLEKSGVRKERIQVVPNAIEPFVAPSAEEITRVRRTFGLTAGQRVILCVGRLSREKAQTDLLTAFEQLTRKHSTWPLHLVIVGDGPERQNLKAQAESMKGFVTFTGQQQDVRPFLAIAELFALPSHSEGSPNVVLEAMMAGVPVVATSVGGVPETLQHGVTGCLVPKQQPDQLASGLEALLRDPQLAENYASAAKQIVQDRFTPDAYCRTLVALYRELV